MNQIVPSAPVAQSNIVNVAGLDLAFRPVPVTDRTPTARQVLAALGVAPHNEYVVLQWLPGGDIEEVRPEKLIDMSDATTPKLIIAKADRTFRFVLNDHSLEWPTGQISEEALRMLGAIPPDHQIYLARENEADHLVSPGQSVNFRAEGVETLYSKSTEWKLKVQGVTIESSVSKIRVRDAIEQAGFDTEAKWIIVLKSASGKRQVEMNDIIDLREPGIEKLRLTPREINNGEVATATRRDFTLLPSDQAWLTEHGYEWSTVNEAGRRWLILKDFELPPGFNVSVVTIAMEIPSAYPMAEIDMFYCFPHLTRLDGQGIPQTQVVQPIEGRGFQRWSRHRGVLAPWRPGKDSVVTHLLLVDEALSREVER